MVTQVTVLDCPQLVWLNISIYISHLINLALGLLSSARIVTSSIMTVCMTLE